MDDQEMSCRCADHMTGGNLEAALDINRQWEYRQEIEGGGKTLGRTSNTNSSKNTCSRHCTSANTFNINSVYIKA